MQELSLISQVSLYVLMGIMGLICPIVWVLIVGVTIIIAFTELPAS